LTVTGAGLQLSSPDVEHGGPLADRFAHDQGNQVPSFTVSGVPEGTVELALICHDPDAPMPDGFVHWLLYGLPRDVVGFGPEADASFRPGRNDFDEDGYGGPQPPVGHGLHHYYFWIYALDTEVEGTPSRRAFIDRYGEHILGQNRLVGTYEN
jgi:Raf kinase inhibitor-like YbhB/YbcL family protein